MFYLKTLSLVNFKNWQEGDFSFLNGVNCLLGENGAGKTNVLDAIHYLSLCKSYFNPADTQQILFDEQFFMIQGDFHREEKKEEVHCAVKRGQKKVFKRNKKEYERLSDHIGLFPLVMISPSDADLIYEGSEFRRRFLDSVISQFDKHYLDQLIEYQRALQQRNALLKRFQESRNFQEDLLEVWDIQMEKPATYISKARNKFLQDFVPVFNNFYREVSGGKESVDLVLKTDLEDQDFLSVLKANRGRDRSQQYTVAGIHKDDLVFLMNGMPVRKFSSQGQQKSYLIALKLAQYSFLAEKSGKKPILLLDDIFDKLDDSRVSRLMGRVSGQDFGQVFITDTSSGKLPELLRFMQVPFKVYLIENGGIAHEQE